MLRLLRVGALFLTLTVAAFGQPVPTPDSDDEEDRPEPAPPAAVRPAPPAAPAARPMRTPAGPNAAAPGQPDMVKLQFPNSDVADVLRFYEQLTGKKLIMDNFVQGKVNIFIAKDLPREEAIKIIQINLLMNGFSLVPVDDDIVKVIGTGKNPRTTGVPIISDPNAIPDADQVISYLFKLRYADPQELQQVLGQYLSPPQTYTSFLALPKSSSLLITENSSVIRTLTRIIEQIDIPPAEVVSEFIKLERADAQKVVDMLKDIFEKGASQTTGPTGQPGVRNVRAPNVPVPQPNQEADVGALTALTEESVVVGKIKLSADVRTNRIHVITRPINMPFVKKLISEFDANVEFAKPVTRSLKYISAGDVLPVLVQALTEPGGQNPGGGADQGQAPLNPNQQQNRPRTTNSTSNQYGAGATSSGGGDSTLNISEELSTNPVDTTPKAVTVGSAKIIADQRANTIIVLGNREVVVKVGKILDEMDVKAPQVALSTVVGELTLNNDEEFGVDWFVKYKNKVVGYSRNTGAPVPFGSASPGASASPGVGGGGGIIDPGGLVNFSQIFQQVANGAAGTNVYLAAGNYFSTIVHALETSGRFKVISRPMVFTSNNKKAIIASGTEIPVPVNTLTNATTSVAGVASVASNIQYKKVALQLEVVPLINSDKEVSLDILQKLDSLAGSTVVDGNSIPNVATRYIRTNVAAPNGACIVLGGLITDDKRRNYNGIPIVSRIPLIGGLFRSTTESKNRTELIILMRPEVTLTKLDLYRLRQKVEDKTHFGSEVDEDCPDCPPNEGDGKQLVVPDVQDKDL